MAPGTSQLGFSSLSSGCGQNPVHKEFIEIKMNKMICWVNYEDNGCSIVADPEEKAAIGRAGIEYSATKVPFQLNDCTCPMFLELDKSLGE